MHALGHATLTASLGTLPFFGGSATTGGNAWGAVKSDLDTYKRLDSSKKIWLTETGWPSNTKVWKANAASAVASVSSQQGYYSMLDAHCADFKATGAGWFFHLYNDASLPGWGLVLGSGAKKFKFAADTSCAAGGGGSGATS